MKFFGKTILGLAALCVGLGLASATANAAQARFTLPVEAHWGKTVLEPGDYRIYFPTAADSLRVIRVSNNHASMSFLIPVTQYELASGRSGRILLVDVDGSYRVKSVSDPVGARIFDFPLPKSSETPVTIGNHQNKANIAVNIKAK